MSNKISYEYNNNLPFIKAGYSGNILVNGRFSKDENRKKTHVFKTLRWFIKKNPQKAQLLQEKSITKVYYHNILWLSRLELPYLCCDDLIYFSLLLFS